MTALADLRLVRGPAADAVLITALIGVSPDGRLRRPYQEAPMIPNPVAEQRLGEYAQIVADREAEIQRLRVLVETKDAALATAERLLADSQALLTRYAAAERFIASGEEVA